MKKTIIWLFILLLGLGNWLSPSPVAGALEANPEISPARLEQQVGQLMEQEIGKLHIPGSAVVVTKGEQIIFSKGYGYADVRLQTPMEPAATRVRVGSLTKTVTATAAMQLVEKGKLELDRDINAYLTAYKVPLFQEQPITLHQLLTHTSGLDQGPYNILALSQKDTITPDNFFREYFRSQPPVRQPGLQFDYNNMGYGLIGSLIEHISGSNLNDYMSEHLFQPLELGSATLTMEDPSSDLPVSYAYKDGEYQPLPYEHFNISGAGEMSVVPIQFAHYMMAHLNQGQYKGRSILNPATVQKMHALQFTAHPRLDGLGYGFFRGELHLSAKPVAWLGPLGAPF